MNRARCIICDTRVCGLEGNISIGLCVVLFVTSFSAAIGKELNRDFLSRIYLTFIRPLFEYASELWDNLTLADSDRLEKFQLKTARIVTGRPSYCSRAALYFETGWDTLKTRREHKKLCLMYKMVNNTAPNYLCELLPSRVGENTMHSLRNTDDFTLPYCRLNLLKIPLSHNLFLNGTSFQRI